MIVKRALPLLLLMSGPAVSQTVAFPQPIMVERQIRQTAPDETAPFETPVSREYYFGNYLVVSRADGSKALIDFERREYTELDVKGGKYWGLSFSRLGELRARIRAAESGSSSKEKKSPVLEAGTKVKIQELPASAKPGLKTRASRRLRATLEGTGNWAEAWFDESIPFGEKAVAALESFETAFAGSLKEDPSRTGELVSALRAAGKGAFVVRFERPLVVKEGRAAGKSEDVILDWKRLEKAPTEQLRIPENFRRIPSPLEALVVFAEEEAELKSRGRR